MYNGFEKLYSFVTDSKVRQEAVVSLLKDKEYLALICELCHKPQDPPIGLLHPKEFVSKFLPLAKVGLKVACVANAVSGLGRVFGLPTPVLSGETLDKAAEFVDAVNKSTLDDFQELQERAKQLHSSSDVGKGSGGEQSVQSMDEGYCVREFRRFLKKEDPDDLWSGLSAKVSDEGYVFFACKGCCDALKP